MGGSSELKQNTYNLTRMNLVMRGIKPTNISTRNGDTLEDDWPFFEDQDPVNTYNPLYLDAVVSNPPYSQKWDPEHKDNDARFSRFGLAPKSKADYAFLLHDLYHLKPDGIMAIVLPHGVLFRGGEEGVIRRELIENDHIDTIIGLPPNIFFGTGIPTIIIVLKQKRTNNDVLIVDASKGFAKEGKNNRLRASDIKKITDTVIGRLTVPRYSSVVPKEEIRGHGYNLNLPRYVNSSAPAEAWDLYASMFGGIPNHELDALKPLWQAFPGLRAALFTDDGTPYVQPAVDDLAKSTAEHADVQEFVQRFAAAFDDFGPWLRGELIERMPEVSIPRQETRIGSEIFSRLKPIPLIDKYHAYQLLDDQWQQTAVDLEILQTEGFDAARVVDPNLVTRKKDGKDVEVQDGWAGRVLPFELVQRHHHREELEALTEQAARRAEIAAALEELVASLSEDEGEFAVLNDANDKFVVAELNRELKEQLGDVETDEMRTLFAYLALLDAKAKKPEKLAFVAEHPDVDWTQIEPNKDGTYGKGKVNRYLTSLRSSIEFPEGTFAHTLQEASRLIDEDKTLNTAIKRDTAALHLKTKATIEGLSDDQVNELLDAKWIDPLNASLHRLPGDQVESLTGQLRALVEKYATTYADNAHAIQQTEGKLAGMIDALTGNEYDMKGLAELTGFLKGGS